MKSRFYYVMHSGEIQNETAIEGLNSVAEEPIEFESVAKLPGVVDRLVDIETLFYADATEACALKMIDLEKHLKLLALESYNDISYKDAALADVPAKQINASMFNGIEYSLRMIEGINNDVANVVRSALEGYLELVGEGYVDEDPAATMHDITEALHIVLESTLNVAFEDVKYGEETTEIIGMESVIKQATKDLGSEDEYDAFDEIMHDFCEEAYTDACEQLVILEGSRFTLFDEAMEAPLDKLFYKNKNKEDQDKINRANATKVLAAAKKTAAQYLKNMKEMQRDIDIDRSRNNNLVLSNRKSKKLDKLRTGKNLEGAIDSMQDIIDRMQNVDPTDVDQHAEINSLADKVNTIYNNAKNMKDTAMNKEKQFIDKQRKAQVDATDPNKGINKKLLGEALRNESSKALRNAATKLDARTQKRKNDELQKLQEVYASGKLTREQFEHQKEKIEKKYASNKLANKIADMSNNMRSKAEAMRDERVKVREAGGNYYREKDLVEKDIEEAFSKKKTGSHTDNGTDSGNQDQKKEETKSGNHKPQHNTSADSGSQNQSSDVQLESPKDASHVRGYNKLNDAQKQQLTNLFNKYKVSYEKFTKMPKDAPEYDRRLKETVKKMNNLKALAKQLENEVNGSGNGGESSQGKPPKGSSKPRNNGRAAVDAQMTPEELKKKENLLRDMTEASERLNDYKNSCKYENKEPDQQKLNSYEGMLKRKQKAYNDFMRKFKEGATEAFADILYDKIDIVKYATNAGFSIYDMAKMSDSALESFFAEIAGVAYDDCFFVATESLKEWKQAREEKKARKKAEEEEAAKKLQEERDKARKKVEEYAADRIKKIDDLQKSLGKKFATYSGDIKNLTERATNGNLRGLRNVRARNIVKKSSVGSKYDLNEYKKILEDLKDTKKELKDLIASKDFIDGYDKTNNPQKDYKKAVKDINQIIGDRLLKKADKSDKKLEKLGKDLEKDPTVQHERNDKKAWIAQEIKEAEKKDRKDNPDKYKKKEAEKVHADYLKSRAELEAQQAAQKAARLGAATESMDLPESVESIEDFGYSIDCMILDLRDSLIDPDIFFEGTDSTGDFA